MVKAVSCVADCDTGLPLVHTSASPGLLSEKETPCSATECVVRLGPACWDHLTHHRHTDIVFHCFFYMIPQLHFNFYIVLLISLEIEKCFMKYLQWIDLVNTNTCPYCSKLDSRPRTIAIFINNFSFFCPVCHDCILAP